MRQTSLINKTIYFLVGEPVCTSILDEIMVVVHANPVYSDWWWASPSNIWFV